MLILSGGIRERAPLDVAPLAERAAAAVGVTRVTEITRLDRLGIPVFVAVRPGAHVGSLCVAAGKGLTAVEARIGAMMEAVEQAWIEPDRGVVPQVRVQVRDILAPGPADAVIDLCPQPGSIIDPDAQILAVEARDVRTGAAVMVPAELVFHPAPPHLGAGYFGSGTNGAAAGSTIAEATLHALIECLERDVLSFHNVRDQSHRVAPSSLPPHITALGDSLEAAGLELIVRALPGAFDLPCFTAILVDRAQPQLSIRGDGLHLQPEVAISRAVTEAAQCRLTVIHGGRDDLDHFVTRFAKLDEDARAAQLDTLLGRLGGGSAVDFTASPALPPGETVAGTLEQLCEHVAARGFPRILRIVLTPPDHPVAVVRVIVPGLECRLADTRRIGRRLSRHARAG